MPPIKSCEFTLKLQGRSCRRNGIYMTNKKIKAY